jgi:hypothetical protein
MCARFDMTESFGKTDMFEQCVNVYTSAYAALASLCCAVLPFSSLFLSPMTQKSSLYLTPFGTQTLKLLLSTVDSDCYHIKTNRDFFYYVFRNYYRH